LCWIAWAEWKIFNVVGIGPDAIYIRKVQKILGYFLGVFIPIIIPLAKWTFHNFFELGVFMDTSMVFLDPPLVNAVK